MSSESRKLFILLLLSISGIVCLVVGIAHEIARLQLGGVLNIALASTFFLMWWDE